MRLSLLHNALPLTFVQSERLLLLLQLIRGRLSALVALSGLAGYLFAGHTWDLRGLLVGLAILLLAAGCSALNQWQERKIDARMERTRNRPLPTGRLHPRQVLMASLLLLLSGVIMLACLPGWLPALLGGFAVFWYNGVYTGLKRLTAYAVLPGALCGALPPLIGWCAAGNEPTAFPIMILAGTLFLWQMPHFWLLACCHRNDHRKSGLPNLFNRFDRRQLFRINNCWILALGLSYLLFPLFGLLQNELLGHLFVTGIGGFALLILKELRKGACAVNHGRLFGLVNLSMLTLLTALLLDTF